MTAVARWGAEDPESPLRPEVRAAILDSERSSKHGLPVEVRRACRVGVAEVRRYREPKAALMGEMRAEGLLRMAEDGRGGLRRLEPGERQVWDDASVNVGVVVPWEGGGDRCSDRYGVRVARFQLLPGIDCATDFCVGYNYIIRGTDAYRGEDVVRSWHKIWEAQGMPDECVVEGGVWQGRRAREFLGAAGVRAISAQGRPWQKLVEGWFNRLWTKMSLALPVYGQVGRYRGEMEEENSEWMACREGRRDPRGRLPGLEEFLGALDRSIEALNREPVESRQYGKWIPAERWGASSRGRRELPVGLWRMALPERHVRVVRNGMVKVACEDAWGGRSQFTFGDRSMVEYEGARVVVSFDPGGESESAVIELAERWHDRPVGLLITGRAPQLNARARLVGGSVLWVSGAADAALERKAGRKLVAEAVGMFDERGATACRGGTEGEASREGAKSAKGERVEEMELPAEWYQEPDWAELERRAGLIA